MKSLFVMISLLILPLGASAETANCKDIRGKWVNQIKSTLTISSISKDGKISGTYSSPSGTDGGTVPLIGWTNEAEQIQSHLNSVRIVSFSAKLGKEGSVASWSGECSIKNGKPTISTIWNLVRANSKFEWDHISTNSDIFIPE